MSYLEISLFVVFILLVFLFLFNNKKGMAKKSAYLKKEEIKESYIKDMKELINQYKHTEELKQQKIIFIKRVNQELSKNIFFTQEEIKKFIYELTTM